MEIACVIGSRMAAPPRPGRSGGSRPGRDLLPDPVAASERTEAMVRALEGIGAAVESEHPDEAFFAVDGLRGGEVVDMLTGATEHAHPGRLPVTLGPHQGASYLLP